MNIMVFHNYLGIYNFQLYYFYINEIFDISYLHNYHYIIQHLVLELDVGNYNKNYCILRHNDTLQELDK